MSLQWLRMPVAVSGYMIGACTVLSPVPVVVCVEFAVLLLVDVVAAVFIALPTSLAATA